MIWAEKRKITGWVGNIDRENDLDVIIKDRGMEK
jgi:hypothetical protein